MDTFTSFVVITFLSLLNGGVLGLVHRGLPSDVRPSAADWRIGTLLFAAGMTLITTQGMLPSAFIQPLYSGCLMLGVTLYWRSIRRFYGMPDRQWIFLPFVVVTIVVFWLTAITPHLPTRIVVAAVCTIVPLTAMTWTLHTQNAFGLTTSRLVLASLIAVVACFWLIRAFYFILLPVELMDKQDGMNMITPLILAILPVIGTTAFLLMASERIRWQWKSAAATDYLTDLPNRRTIVSHGEARFNATRRMGGAFAIAIIDIDHFKAINDKFGHDVGDEALKHIATILNEACRGPSMVGRYGGEEFVALLDDADAYDALAAGERLRSAIADNPLNLPNSALPTLIITASIGVSVIKSDDNGLNDLLRRADVALYEAKSMGRNRVVLCSA